MSDRRRFFRELLQEAAGVAHELSSALQAANEPDEWRPPPPVPARPATGLVDEGALADLCRELGLGRRAADARRVARVSLRLTRRGAAAGAEIVRSYLGGSPDLPPDFAWPSWNGRDLAFLAQIELSAIAAAGAHGVLPPHGLLLFFYDLARLPSGLSPSHRGSCRVVAVAGELERDERRSPALPTLPIEVSAELMLPGAWSFQAEELELSPDELDTWDALRARLALAQGVELEEASAERFALHRLLGFPEEIGREIEVDCELASAGLNADDADVYYESRAHHEAAARTWRLLLQLSADDSLGLWTAREFERLYVCIRESDLRARNFDGAWAALR